MGRIWKTEKYSEYGFFIIPFFGRNLEISLRRDEARSGQWIMDIILDNGVYNHQIMLGQVDDLTLEKAREKAIEIYKQNFQEALKFIEAN